MKKNEAFNWLQPQYIRYCLKYSEINKKNKQLKLSIKEFETDSKQAKREKIVETKNGFDSIANKLGEWISTKMDEINSKK